MSSLASLNNYSVTLKKNYVHILVIEPVLIFKEPPFIMCFSSRSNVTVRCEISVSVKRPLFCLGTFSARRLVRVHRNYCSTLSLVPAVCFENHVVNW